MNIPWYHEDPAKLHVNTLETRSYYIPYGSKNGALAKAASTRVLNLGGDWDFAYYPSPYDLPENAFSTDFDSSVCKPVPVPSVWQTQDYDRHQYTNVKYPFPYDPPFVPSLNPCGLYIRNFTLPSLNGNRCLLNFEGVDSCFYVYIGGEFAGYSQVSHSTSEFDVTEFAHEGENHIAVLVLKWCDGSYLEDQDKFRMSGIFRDVYLIMRPEKHLRDYFVHADISGRIAVELNGDIETEATLFDPNGTELAMQIGTETIAFKVDDPILWNAENPALYTLLLHAGGEYIAQKIGLREVKVEDGIILLNGLPIRINGVNRHDSDPVTGCVISRGQAIRDLALMKQHNINAIRTSHYPNAPWFPQLCDEYGFYLIAEADLEIHGTTTIYGGSQEETFGLLAQDQRFNEAILDRIQRCVIRDKNCPSILFWSLGNESGYGESFKEAGRWVKKYDPSRLLHYESSVWETGGYENDTSMLDVYSRMYASTLEITDYFENTEHLKPFILCEYIHAMGNGPGDGEDYFRLMEKCPGFCGGFVWEWCDHAIYMGKTAEGREKYFYGGDFGEFPHDGNFCMDGLVYPNRTPHKGLLEYKNICRPLRASLNADSSVTLTNMLRFTGTGEFITADFEVTKNGEVIERGGITPNLAPLESRTFNLGYHLPDSGSCHLNIIYRQTAEHAFTNPGHILGFDQLELRREVFTMPSQPSLAADCVKDFNNTIVVKGANFRYVFDKLTGTFSEMIYKNRLLLEKPIGGLAPMGFNIWRAPTDNDRNIRSLWEEAGYDRTVVRVYSAGCSIEDGLAVIRASLGISAIHIQRILTIEVVWRIGGDGSVTTCIDCDRNTGLPFLPRFGLRMFLPQTMSNVRYLGYGPHESYADKRRASYYGKFMDTADAMHEDYLKPQENGSHWGCDELEVSGGGLALRVLADGFSFNVSPYTQEELAAKPHNFELVKCGHTVLCLDYAQSGIGSNSCGPELMPQYRLDTKSFTFRFYMKPVGISE